MYKAGVNRRQSNRPAASAQGLSLRRLDWRFLLPHPPQGKFQHLRLFGGSRDLADLMVSANLAACVTCCSPAEPMQAEPVDAVVILHGCDVDVARAVKGLVPGGVLYQEIARRSPAALRQTPARIRRRLQEAGLTPTGLYWVAPNFEQCKRMVPLDVPGVVQWYLSTLFVAGTPLHGVIKGGIRLLAGRNHRGLGALAPCLSVTAVAGDAAQAAQRALPGILSRAEVQQLLAQDGAERGLWPMLLTSGQDDASRLVMLPFALDAGGEGCIQPQAVIKVATHPRFNAETAREQETVQTVRAKLDARLQRTIPKACATFEHGGLAVGVQGVAPGRTLWASSGDWGGPTSRKIDDLRLGVRWLADFHAQTEARRIVWDRQAIAAWIEEPLAAYRQAVAVTPAEQRLFARLLAYAETLAGTSLPLAWQHHDFAPWNIYRDGDELTIIDWEANRSWAQTEAGPGLCDVLYFAVHWHNVAQRLFTLKAELQGLTDLFVYPAAKPPAAAARAAIGDYMEARAIDRRFLPLLLVYTWVERVVYSAARGAKLDAAGAQPSHKFMRYVQTLANHADALFHPGHVDRLLRA